MLTLYHAPFSRSSRIVTLLDEMGIADKVTIQPVNIPRMDGTGAVDPANPHPEGKAPALVHDGVLITESAAIILYLSDLFPDAALAPKADDPRRGDFLTWLFWYGNVVEPVLIHGIAKVSHPYLEKAFRGPVEVAARLRTALTKNEWLLGDQYSAADLLLHSPFAWFREATPDDPLIASWVDRCIARPAFARTNARDAEWLQVFA